MHLHALKGQLRAPGFRTRPWTTSDIRVKFTNMKSDESTRPYTMRARARSAEETGERILDSAKERFSRLAFDEVTLNDIADDARVTVQTVIRRFGSKEDLFSTLAKRESERIIAEREPLDTDADNMASAVRALVAHYERDGGTVLNLLSQETRFPMIADVMATGREMHEKWVMKHCRPVLGSSGPDGRRRLEAAIAATDLYTWKLLRLDRGLGREEVEKTMLALLEGLGNKGER